MSQIWKKKAEQYPRGYDFAQRFGHRTVLVAPLLREGEPFGTMMLRRKGVRPFSEREISLLRTFGDQAAIALASVRHFNETEEALEQQTATSEILRVISSSVADTKPVFEKILDSCERLFQASGTAIFLIDDNGQIDLGAPPRGGNMEAVADIFPTALKKYCDESGNRRTSHFKLPSITADPVDDSSTAASYHALPQKRVIFLY